MRAALINRQKKAKPNLHEVSRRLGKLGGTKLPVDILVVDDASIAKLAGRFRNSPRATDVLAFYYGDLDLSGEIAVSAETALRQARERRVRFSDELTLLCVHGLLHLAGEDDEAFDSWCKMRISEFETMMKIL